MNPPQTSQCSLKIGVLAPIYLSADLRTKIPPATPRWFVTTGCTVERLTEPITFSQVSWHAHLIGKAAAQPRPWLESTCFQSSPDLFQSFNLMKEKVSFQFET